VKKIYHDVIIKTTVAVNLQASARFPSSGESSGGACPRRSTFLIPLAPFSRWEKGARGMGKSNTVFDTCPPLNREGGGAIPNDFLNNAGWRCGRHVLSKGTLVMFKKFNFANIGLVLFYLAIILIFSLFSPTFRTVTNFKNILTGFSHVGIMAVGMTFPILLGGIDLSVGAILALVGMVAFDVMLVFGLPGWVAILAGLVVGALAGLLNGLLVVRLKLTPFIATLSTMVAYRGATYAISGRQLYPGLSVKAITDPVYRGIDGSAGPVPLAFIYLIAVILLTYFLLRHTKLGLNLYSVGGNENAARLAGINIGRVKLIAYMMSGLCTGIAALILTSRMTTATENLGLGFELSAIAGAIIGGVSLQGGVGNTFGPAVGAFLIGTIYIGMTLLGVTTYAQPVVSGFILMGAVGYDQFMKVRREQNLLKRQSLPPTPAGGQ